MSQKRKIHTPEIPEAFEELANEWNLTIDHVYGLRSYFVRDIGTSTPLISYREAEFLMLTAETLEANIEQAIEEYEHRPIDIAIGSRPLSRHHRQTVYLTEAVAQ